MASGDQNPTGEPSPKGGHYGDAFLHGDGSHWNYLNTLEHKDHILGILADLVASALADEAEREREACAKECDRVALMSMTEIEKLVPHWTENDWGSEMLCAAAIRQRKEQP